MNRAPMIHYDNLNVYLSLHLYTKYFPQVPKNLWYFDKAALVQIRVFVYEESVRSAAESAFGILLWNLVESLLYTFGSVPCRLIEKICKQKPPKALFPGSHSDN